MFIITYETCRPQYYAATRNIAMHTLCWFSFPGCSNKFQSKYVQNQKKNRQIEVRSALLTIFFAFRDDIYRFLTKTCWVNRCVSLKLNQPGNKHRNELYYQTQLIKKTFSSSQTSNTAVNGPLKLFCIIKALAAKLVFDYDLSLHLHFRHKQKNPMNTLAPFMHVRTATLE